VYNIPQTSSPPPLYFSPPSLPLFQTVFGGFHYAVFIYVYVTYFHLLYTKELIKMFNKYLLNLNTLLNLKKKKSENCQAPVAHTCNPSYSGGRDQEDGSSKAA
jgi:hypothetical protein